MPRSQCGKSTEGVGASSPLQPDTAVQLTPFHCSHMQVVAALEGLRSGGALFSASVDAVCELVWVSVDPESGMVVPLMMPLVQVGEGVVADSIESAMPVGMFSACQHLRGLTCWSEGATVLARTSLCCTLLRHQQHESAYCQPLPQHWLPAITCCAAAHILPVVHAGPCASRDVPAPPLQCCGCSCCS